MEKLFGKSPTNISKITYFQKYVRTQVFVFVLECKEDDGRRLRMMVNYLQTSPIEIQCASKC